MTFDSGATTDRGAGMLDGYGDKFAPKYTTEQRLTAAVSILKAFDETPTCCMKCEFETPDFFCHLTNTPSTNETRPETCPFVIALGLEGAT